MNGSVDRAISMAQAAARAGCAGYKVQLLDPEKIAAPTAPLYWSDDFGTHTQRAAFTKAGLIDYSAWGDVKAACDDFGITFFATPFDLPAVDALENLGVELYKVASGDITYTPLLQRIAETKKPVILSTGASELGEVWDALGWLEPCEVIPLACNLAYPTGPGDANLARIATLKVLYGLAGYSDHTTGVLTALGAAALGACVLEKHYTWDRTAPDVADHAMALDPDGMKRYVEAANLGVELRGSGELCANPSERAAHHGARRSVCAARDLRAMTALAAEDLICLRPGGGIPPSMLPKLVGRVLLNDLVAGEMLPEYMS